MTIDPTAQAAETVVETTVVEPTVVETSVETPEAEPTDREKLESSVGKLLDAMDADEDADESEDEPEAPATETAGADDSLATEPKPTKEAAAAVTPAASTLPAAHVRSLKAFGLTDQEIADTTPTVAAALHARRNQEITRWAEQGRQARPNPQTQAPAPQQAAAVTVTQPASKGIDIETLRQQYGTEEPLIAKLAEQEKELTEFRTFRQQYQAQAQAQQLDTLGRDIDGFFAAKELAPYHATYGTAAATATPEQMAKREEVLKLADAIVGGAKQNGVQLSLTQALQHAFDATSAPIAKQAARQEIKKELTARSKALSLKPAGRPTPKANTRKELESRVGAALKSL
jgi:hypothetical protein